MKTFTLNLRTLFFIALCGIIINNSVFAQAPDKMSYQAVIRDAADNLVVNSPIGMQISILQGSETGNPVYVETQTPTSNANGLVSLEIGNGSVESGDFSSIDWTVGPYFIKTETDPTGGTGYTISGTSQLMSVPFALYAKSSGSSVPYTAGAGIAITGNTIENTAPDQNVNITGSGSTTVSGFYPDFTISSTDLVDDADNDPTNEIELPPSAVNGQVLAWNGSSWVAQNPGSGADNWGSQVVQTSGSNLSGDGSPGNPLVVNETDGSVSNELQVISKTGSTVTLSNGGGSFTDAVNDADANATNELQSLSLSGNQLSISDGNSVNLPTGTTYTAGTDISITGNAINNTSPDQTVVLNGTGATTVSGTYPNFTINSTDAVDDADASATNELQTISKTGSTVTLSNGGGSFTDAVNDADADATNELQDISLSGNNLSISDGSTVDISGIDNGGWSTSGNAGTDPNNDFIGTTDAVRLTFKVNNLISGKIYPSESGGTFLGYRSGEANSITGVSNTAFGYFTLKDNTFGDYNTAIGNKALTSNLTGHDNASFGYQALSSNETGINNTASGSRALLSNISGNHNTAIGFSALIANTSGHNNTAFGSLSLRFNETGDKNTAVGKFSLYHNISGSSNVAIGNRALFMNQSKSNLVAIGDSALYNNTSGKFNTAIGSKALYSNVSGNENTANGYEALFSSSAGFYNTAIGFRALKFNTTGSSNTAVGDLALLANTTGYDNISIGFMALSSNTTGNSNTVVGTEALRNNITGKENTAVGGLVLNKNTANFNTSIGYQSLNKNISGSQNVAIGGQALFNNTTAPNNTSIGYKSSFLNTTGTRNTTTGTFSMFNNDTGNDNVASGYQALTSNETGSFNVAYGTQAAFFNVFGAKNVAVGYRALYNMIANSENVAIGYMALDINAPGSQNVAIGANAGATNPNSFNSVALGNQAKYTGSHQVRIGNSSIISIGGFAGWTNASDKRFKKDINENVVGLDFILKLRPVTYHLNMDAIASALNTPEELRMRDAEQQKSNMLQTGFIAQEVEQTAAKLGYEFSGVDAPKNADDYYGLRYAEFVVPLVKATQEQQTLIEAQQAQIEQQQKEIDQLKKLVSQMLINQND